MLESMIQRAENIAFDLDLDCVREWKRQAEHRRAIGFMPIYFPRELIHAAGMLPVGLMGGGDRLEIIRGDAYFQSYICHIPRSTTEMAVSGRLDCLDGMIFPSICDVIRNLSGMWKILFPGKYVHYFDFPQTDDARIAVKFYAEELASLRGDFEKLAGRSISDEALSHSIAAYNENRRLVREVYDMRRARPWDALASEAYIILRAGNHMTVEDHSRLLREYLDLVPTLGRNPLDNVRIVVTGAFCEQPPVALLKTLERAGCDIVDDDFILGNRWVQGDMDVTGDPIRSLAEGFIHRGVQTASKYSGSSPKGAWLVDRVRETRADGVIFCAASFCDPALLEEPMLKKALDAAGVPHTSFKFSEDTGQFGAVREQAGTFADSIRLWSQA